jgi:hypothetical protein
MRGIRLKYLQVTGLFIWIFKREADTLQVVVSHDEEPSPKKQEMKSMYTQIRTQVFSRYLNARGMRAFLLFFGMGVFLFSCNDDEGKKTAGPLLTVVVDESYTVDGDNWIFVTDLSGEVLDTKSYATGQTVTFSATNEADKINVTIFQGHDAGNLKELSFRTYTNLDRGDSLKLSLTATTPPTSSPGEATIEISNYSDADNVPSSLLFSNTQGWSNSATAGVLDAVVTLPQSPADVLVSGYRSGVPVYSWVSALMTDDVVQRDFAAFDAYPKQIKLDYPGLTSGSIVGYYAGSPTPYFLSNSSQLDLTTFKTNAPTLGYLEGFDHYQTYVLNQNDAGSVSYYKTGSVNTSIAIPAFTFSLTNGDIKNFSFNFSEEYTYFDAQWQYQEDTNWIHWNIESEPGQFSGVTSIPAEIRSLYPQLDFSKLEYFGCTLIKFLDGRKYHDAVPYTTNQTPTSSELYNFNPTF